MKIFALIGVAGRLYHGFNSRFYDRHTCQEVSNYTVLNRGISIFLATLSVVIYDVFQ